MRRGRTFSSAPSSARVQVRLRLQRERRDRPADRADRHARRAETIAARRQRVDSHRRCRTTRASPPNFMNALRAFPADQQAGLIASSSPIRRGSIFRELTPADIHPVALNILNTKRDGQFLIPSPTGRPADPQGQRHLRPRVPAAAGDPDRARRAGPDSDRCSTASAAPNQTRVTLTHDRRRTSRRRSAGPTRRRRRRSAQTPALARRRLEHAQLRLAAAARSQRRLLRPAEHAHLEEPRHPQLHARHLQPARVRRSAASPR